MKLFAFVRKLVRNVRDLIVGAQNFVLALCSIFLFFFSRVSHVLNGLEIICIIFSKLWNPKIEGDYFGTTFPGSDLDQIMHEEP